MQKHVNIVDLVKSFPTNILLQNLVSIQKRTSPVKFAHLAEKSGKGSIPNLSTKARGAARAPPRARRGPAALHRAALPRREPHARPLVGPAPPQGRGERPFTECIFRKFCKFLAGSFSAVSKRNFARKYAFDSIFQALQDLHPFAPLQSQNFRKKIGLKNCEFRKISENFRKFSILANSTNFLKKM